MSRLIAAVAIVVALAPVADAHDIGVTQAVATFHSDGRYQIEISVDPDALLTRLELTSGVTMSASLTSDERDRRIDALRDTFLEEARVIVDGRVQEPEFQYKPAPPAVNLQAPSTVTLSGRTGPDPIAWTFEYEFAMGWFQVETRAPGGSARANWIEGGKLSPPMSIADHLLPGGTKYPKRRAEQADRAEQAPPLQVRVRSVVGPVVLLGIVAITRRGRGRNRSYRFGIVQK